MLRTAYNSHKRQYEDWTKKLEIKRTEIETLKIQLEKKAKEVEKLAVAEALMRKLETILDSGKVC